MGHQYHGAFDNYTGKLQVCSGHSWILHKVDRGEASSQYSRSGAQKILLVEHNMSFRGAQKDNSWQHQAVWLPYVVNIAAVAFASVYHPQLNGAVERANALIFSTIKKILEDQSKGKWAEELPRVVWSHNTSVSRATNFMPLKMLYGEEPITLGEIKLWSMRTRLEAIYSPTKAESKCMLEPEWMKAVEKLQSYQNEMRAWRDKKVKQQSIEAKDLVPLRSPHTEASGKLESKWVGPFLVTEKTRSSSFRLADTEGKVLQHSCNSDNLRRFYI